MDNHHNRPLIQSCQVPDTGTKRILIKNYHIIDPGCQKTSDSKPSHNRHRAPNDLLDVIFWAFIFWAFIKGQFLSDLIVKCTLGVGTIIPGDICTNFGDSIAICGLGDGNATNLF